MTNLNSQMWVAPLVIYSSTCIHPDGKLKWAKSMVFFQMFAKNSRIDACPKINHH